MPKSKFLVVKFLTILVMISSAVFMISFLQNRFDSHRSFSGLEDREIVSIWIDDPNEFISLGDEALEVEIVNTQESTKQGLSGRDEIGSDGMLFIFPGETIRTFWMFDVNFNLDFVWINGNEVVGLTKNVEKPEKNTKIEDLELISVAKSTDKVLELNAGDIDRYGIEVGDVIIIK